MTELTAQSVISSVADPRALGGSQRWIDAPFAFYLVSVLTSSVGTSMIPVVMTFGILDQGGTTRDTGLALGLETLLFAGLVLAGGSVADRTDRSRAMMLADAARCLVSVLLAFAVLSGSTSPIPFFAAAALVGAANAFFVPASNGLVPEVAPAERLSYANGAVGAGAALSSIAGPAAAGMLIAATGTGWAIVAVAAAYGASALASAVLRHRPHIPPGASASLDLRAGWRELRRHSWLVPLVAQCAFLNVVAIAPMLLIGSSRFHAEAGGAASWGAVMAAVGIGGVAGALMISAWQPARCLCVVEAAIILLIVPLTALGSNASTLVVVVGGLLFGMTLATITVVLQTLVQRSVPSVLLSRVNALIQLMIAASLPVGYAIMALLSPSMAPETILWSAAVLVVASCAGAVALPSIRKFSQSSFTRPTA